MSRGVVLADGFNFLFVFAPDAFGIVLPTERPGRFIAVFLEGMDLVSNPAKRADDASIILGIGDELLDGLGLKQVTGHLTGGELKPDLRDLAGLLLRRYWSRWS